MHDIPSSTRASTSLEAAVNQYGSDTIASSPCQPYGASYGTNPVTDRNSRVLQKNVATHLEKTSVNKENALPKRANDKLSCSSLPTQATKSTTPKSLNSKLVSSITAIRNSKRDSKGNKVSHLHAAKKTLEANSLKVSRFVSPKAALTIIDHTTRVEKIGPSSPPMKRKMNEVTGEPLNQRKDDTAAVLMSRLEAFHKQTAPVTGEPLNQRKDDTAAVLMSISADPIYCLPNDDNARRFLVRRHGQVSQERHYIMYWTF